MVLRILVVAFCFASLISCTTDSRDSTKTFRVAFNTWIGYSPLVIAKEKGFLKKRGLGAEITFLEGIGEKNSALLRGDIDGVGHTADSAVTSAAAGVDGKIVFVFDRSLGADAILARNTIKSVNDLKGKKIALEPGFTGHFFFLYLLREAGLSQDDVEIVAMDTGSAGSAFVSGKVDAAVTWEPWIGKAKELDDAHILISSADRPGVIIDVLFMRTATISERPSEVQKLIEAMAEATSWYASNKEEGDKIIATFWKLDLKEAQETVAGMKFMSLDENKQFFGTSSNPKQLLATVSAASDLWLRAKVIDKPIDPRSVIDFSSVDAASLRN